VRWRADWLYIYLLLEFQSTVDRYMAVRLQVYVGLLYQALIRAQQLPLSGQLPPVVPVVLYNGQRRWMAPLEMGALVAEVPGLKSYRPRFPYALLDVGRYAEHELAAFPNLAAALFRLENSRAPEDVRRVLGVRLARIRFGEACAEALAPLLEARDDPEELAALGEWLVTAATSEDFLTSIRAQWPPR